MGVSRVLSCALGALVCALCAGCAHTQSGAEPSGEADAREVTVLRERVARLERRLSDLDAQMALLTRKVAETPRDSVSLGSPGYAPPPVSYGTAPSAPAAWTGYPSSSPSYEDERSWQRDPSTRSIDLGPSSPRTSSIDLPPIEPADDDEGDSLAGSSLSSGSVAGVISSGGASLGSGGVGSEGPPRGDAQTVYDWAHARRKEGRFLEAIAAFEDVLERHASHHLADNALYWTAQCHLERGEPRLAIDVWRTLPMRFPKSPKMPDSLYGMALAHEELGEPVLAETLYGQLVQQYPKAEKVPEARKALKRLRGSPDAPR